MDAEVRWACYDDAAGIARVHTLGWQQGFAGLLPEEFLARRVVSAPSWQDWLARPLPRSAVFVAEIAEQVVGFALVGPTQETTADVGDEHRRGELKALYLLSAFWGTGLGHRLHQAGLVALRELGYHQAQLSVLADNTRAVTFYQRHGWSIDGSPYETDLGGVCARVLRMRQDLTEVGDGSAPQSSSVR